jgi:hypothetical protein
MTLLQTHHRELFGSRSARGGSRFSAKAVAPRIASAFKAMHRAIAAAKLHRLRNELMLHRGTPNELDASKVPQRPMILSDKWDF